MSSTRGFRQRSSGGVFPVLTRVRWGSVVIQTPNAHKNHSALSPAGARRLAKALVAAAKVAEGGER